MAKIDSPSKSLQMLIDEYYEGLPQERRGHMGASIIGHPCDRWLWLSFRWAVIEKFPGKILRIFQQGHHEEQVAINDLRSIGVEVRAPKGRQSRVEFGCHVSGSLDGIIEHGLPEAPKTKHVLEVKSHKEDSFKRLRKEGVEKSNPKHYAQMQAYMHGKGIKRALYYAINKNNRDIYRERIEYNKVIAEKIVERAKRITMSERMPEPVSSDPTWWECKFCPAHEFCYQTNLTKEVNCRTCAHSTPTEASTWRCEKYEQDVPEDFQQKGCECHVLHPDLVPWKRKESSNPWEAVYEIDGDDMRNGEPDANVYGSKELIADPEACKHPAVNKIRDVFDAVITDAKFNDDDEDGGRVVENSKCA
jgi:CRISPR/Cas system-associated exonuclease Cas4 (RecB family)